MKFISLGLTSLFFVIATSAFAWNEPDGFMGLRFWRPVPEGTLPECPLKTSPSQPSLVETLPNERSARGSISPTESELAESRQRVLESIKKSRVLGYEDKQRFLDSLLAGVSKKSYDEVKTWELKKPCWQELGSDGNNHEIKNVVLGEFNLDVSTESLEGKLAHIFIVFPQKDYGQIFLTFKERYGAPTSSKTETVQSRIGAKFKNEIFKWEGRRVTITLDKMVTVDKGTITYDTDIWRTHSAQKLQQEIKKAAKNL